jgi:hypothetical protein
MEAIWYTEVLSPSPNGSSLLSTNTDKQDHSGEEPGFSKKLILGPRLWTAIFYS